MNKTTWIHPNPSQFVDILVNDRPIKTYGAEGKSFVEARHGAQYEIRLRNNGSRRVLAVVSVDGLDVLTGKSATPESGGYIIPAFGSYVVKGFRVSDNAVNRFEFADKGKSYANLGEDGEQSTASCGVIGVQFYSEKETPVFTKRYFAPTPNRDIPWEPYRPATYSLDSSNLRQSLTMKSGGDSDEHLIKTSCLSNVTRSATTNGMAGGCSAGEFDMGTKFSEEQVTDKVTTTTFVRAGAPNVVTIYYASRPQLEAFGVEFEPVPKVVFPEAFKPSGYCKPPKRG